MITRNWMGTRSIIDNLKFRATVSLYTDCLVKIIKACQCSYVFINKTNERIFPSNRETTSIQLPSEVALLRCPLKIHTL